MTIGIHLGDVWSHYCTLNEDGEVVGRGRFRTSPSGVEKWFTDLPRVRIAMEAGTHSIWISEQLQELGHEVIVANVRELRAISPSDRKSDTVDAEKIARYARLDPKILRPIAHRTVAQQEALTLIRARTEWKSVNTSPFPVTYRISGDIRAGALTVHPLQAAGASASIRAI
jgi:transposase